MVRFDVDARVSTRNAEVEANVETLKYVVVACVEVALVAMSPPLNV